MKLTLDLACASKPEWINAVITDFDAFLQDHAQCEKKASAMAMSFVAKYPDRVEIIPELIDTAVEELEHFRDVYKVMEARGVQLRHQMGEDPYIKQLLNLCRTGRDDRFLDRLMIASIVENRGAERFRLVEENLEDPELKRFYKMLWTSEARHGNIFTKMALQYFDEDMVYDRLQYLTDKEAEILNNLEIRAALH